MIRRAICQDCYYADKKYSAGCLDVVTAFEVIGGLKTMYDLRKSWKKYKQENGVANMSLYELNQKHKNGELEPEAKEFADKFFGQRVECDDCGQFKRMTSFQYPAN